jgi:hypothetical protein
MFNKNEFRQKFFEYLPDLNRIKELPNIVLDLFVADVRENTYFNQNKDKFKFIQSRRGISEEQNYRIMNANYSNLKNNIARVISGCSNLNSENEYLTFIPQQSGSKPPILFLAILLELFGLASYQIIGGMNTEIFIRVNDPLRLKRLSELNYSNGLLTEIERKRKRSQEILSNFMTKEFDDEERWNLIEEYFLGKDDLVNEKLGLL